jgi:hypothetical protein
MKRELALTELQLETLWKAKDGHYVVNNEHEVFLSSGQLAELNKDELALLRMNYREPAPGHFTVSYGR